MGATMNAFQKASIVEAESMRRLMPWLERRAKNGHLVTTAKGRLSKELQTRYGDILLDSEQRGLTAIECKAEKHQRETENLFLETWSNLSRFTPGWMLTLDADVLLYHFLDGYRGERLYAILFDDLRDWAFRQINTYGYIGKLWECPARPQAQYDQMNDTWGRLAPIARLTTEAGLTDITQFIRTE